jgi:hypothetical protein
VAQRGREGTLQVEVREVNRGDGGACAGDAGPVARCRVLVFPVSESVSGVDKAALGFQQKKTVLVERGGDTDEAEEEE